MPNFEELDFKVGPSFIEYKRPFSISIQDGGLARLKTSVSDRSWKHMIPLPPQKGTNLETKLLEIRHVIVRPEFSYLGLLSVSNVCGVPTNRNFKISFESKILSPWPSELPFQNRCSQLCVALTCGNAK